MPTPFDEVNNIFYDLVEADPEFFDYYGIDASDSIQLAEMRADSCLMQAATKLALETNSDVNFSAFSAEERMFAADLTQEEKYLLARLQYQQYLYRDFATLRAQATRFTSAEQTVFSPANDRKTFLAMYESLRAENDNLINAYLWKDRATNSRKTLQYEDL